MSKQKTIQIIQSVLAIIVGILVACSIINSNILNYILASAILLYGIFLLFKAIYEDGTLIYLSGIASAVLIGISVSIFASYINAIDIIGRVIMVSVASIGGMILISSIVSFVKKQVNIGITKLVVGSILLALGLILILIPEVGAYTWCIFGVLVAIFGVYELILCFVKKSIVKKIK